MSSRHHIEWFDVASRIMVAIAIVGVGGCAAVGQDHPPAHPELAAAPDCLKVDAASRTMTEAGDIALGCFNRANLRAMVADQRDLDHGQVLAPASGAQEARGIEAYKKGEVKKLNPTDDGGSTTPSQPPEAK